MCMTDRFSQFHFNLFQNTVSLMSEEGDYSLPLLHSEWKCPFASGRQVNSGFGKMSPSRMSFSVQNVPEVLLGLLSPLDRQSWSCPLAKRTGLQ